MNTAIGWNPAAPAAALRRLQAQLLRPNALAWFEQLVPDGSDPWARFEALIAAAMSGTPVDTPRAVPTPATPYAPRHAWPSPLPTASKLAPTQAAPSPASAAPLLLQPGARNVTSASPPPAFAALRTARAGTFAEAASPTRATSAATADRPAPVAAAAAGATASPQRAPALPTGPGTAPGPRPGALRQTPSSTPAAPLRNASMPAATITSPAPSARVIGWPRAHQQASDGELPAEPKRTRVVEGLPALRQLMQTAVAQSQQPPAATQQPDAAPAMAPLTPPSAPALALAEPSAAPAASRAVATADPLAVEALVDRVIDRLDERLREMSIRHLGFTGGLGT